MWAVLLSALFLNTGAIRGPPPPDCTGLPDGLNVYPGREWSPYFIVCRSEVPLDTGYCPREPVLTFTRFFHPVKRYCVTLYEIPKPHSPYFISCASKADGLHLDDVTNRADVYYRCRDGELETIHKCEENQYFDEAVKECSAKPLYNSIMSPGLMNKEQA